MWYLITIVPLRISINQSQEYQPQTSTKRTQTNKQVSSVVLFLILHPKNHLINLHLLLFFHFKQLLFYKCFFLIILYDSLFLNPLLFSPHFTFSWFFVPHFLFRSSNNQKGSKNSAAFLQKKKLSFYVCC